MEKIWQTKQYYQKAYKASTNLNHPAMKKLAKLAISTPKILEVGCGEGTKLNSIITKKNQAIGIDISSQAIKIASKKYPQIKFIQADGEQLPFDNDSFDLAYSAFSLEHTQNPTKFVKEIIRVVKKEGFVVFIAPNYGAPFRCSPCFKESRIKKIIEGFWQDILPFQIKVDNLNWHKVDPIYNTESFVIDQDTTVEPYLKSLMDFVKFQGLQIIDYSSCWEILPKHETIIHRTFRFLGQISLFPFKYWGPHLFVLAKKI